MEFAAKHLQQEIDMVTHAAECLDLIWSNNSELVSGCQAESFTEFSDHKLVIAHTTFKLGREKAVLEQQFMCLVASRYNALDFNKAPWTEIETELGNIDWSPMEDLSWTPQSGNKVWLWMAGSLTCHQLYLVCHKGQYLDRYCSSSTSQA